MTIVAFYPREQSPGSPNSAFAVGTEVSFSYREIDCHYRLAENVEAR